MEYLIEVARGRVLRSGVSLRVVMSVMGDLPVGGAGGLRLASEGFSGAFVVVGGTTAAGRSEPIRFRCSGSSSSTRVRFLVVVIVSMITGALMHRHVVSSVTGSSSSSHEVDLTSQVVHIRLRRRSRKET